MIPKVLLLIDFSEEYGRGLLNGIARYSRLFGPWSFCRIPLVYRDKGNVEEIIEWARNWNPDGIIAQIINDVIYEQLTTLKKPLIAQDAYERFPMIPNITGLYHETGKMAAKYFLDKGFKHFAFYGFDDIVWSRERCQGFAGFLDDKGYSTHIYEHPKEAAPPLWSYKASLLSEWLLSLPKPLALMACDDNQGQHVTEACKAAGIKIPEQISVLGVDNDGSICNLSDPPLSSIALNTEKAGFETARLLHQMMLKPEGKFYDIFVEPIQIITRRSTEFLAVDDIEVNKALHFIYHNFKDEIDVEHVVAATSLSRRVLEKRFRKLLNRSILSEITSLRINHVKQLLTETSLPINEIAMLAGYAEIKNMSRYFRTSEGITPLEYRKKVKG